MLRLIDKKFKLLEFIRFIIVGGTATIIHYSIYYLLQKFIGVKPNLAYTLGYGISFIFNFIASNYFTFKTKVSAKKGIKFSIAHCINYLIQIGLLNVYIKIGISSVMAPIFIFILSIPLNFIMVSRALNKK